MATKTIEFKFRIGDTLTDVSSAVLRDPTNTFGVRRADNNAIIVASGTALTRVSVGVYRYQFTEPASGLSYEYWLEYTYLGNTRRERQVLQGSRRGIAGSVPIAPSAYVTMGIQTVSCGDADLETFLSVHAATVWAMQARRGVALDLRYQYFVLDLITLALDFVRTMVDNEIATQEMTETGYANGSNNNSSNSDSTRNRTSSSTQSATGAQSFARTASRSTSLTESETANRSLTRSGAGSDASTQLQSSSGSNTRSSTQNASGSGSLTGSGETNRTSDASGSTSIDSEGIFTRVQAAVSAAGIASLASVSEQGGNQTNGGGSGQFLLAAATGTNSRQRTSSQTMSHSLTGSSSFTATGSRNNLVSRTSTSEMTGSASSSMSSTTASSSHDEQQRTSESTFHSEALGHSEMSASALAHRESLGASSMQASGLLAKNYYDQIFQSLKLMRENTVSQIAQLSQQIHMTTRVIIQKLSVTKPQAGLVVQAAARTSISQNPSGLGLVNTGFDIRTVR